MATLAQIRDGYNRLNSRLIRGAGTLAQNVYNGLGSWRDDDVDRFIAVLGPQVDGLKLQAGRLQNAYYLQVAKANGEAFTPTSITAADVDEVAIRNGAETREVYRRPFVETYTQLAKGSFVGEAIAAGAARAFSIAATDVQLASREAGRKVRGNNNNIVGHRRTLVGPGDCALCVIASTQRYTRNELKPIHPGCNCGEEPIYGDFDPGQVIDPEGLESIHAALVDQLGVSDAGARSADIGKFVTYEEGGTRLADFTEIIATREHGEYGPTLTWRNQKFTGPSDL